MASFGETLKRERELRGVSLREIADSTKISARFLDAIERDRLDILPGGVFRRAFVREYARALGLDADRVVADFLFAHGIGTEEAAPAPPRQAPHHGAWVLALFALVMVPLLALKIWQARPTAENEPTPLAVVQRVYPTPAPSVDELAVPEGLALTLTAKERCWVSVRADGHAVLDRVLSAGESETVQAQGELVLSVGNAGGLDFRVDDRPGVSLGKIGEVRRNIVITRENLPSLVQDTTPAPAPGSHL